MTFLGLTGVEDSLQWQAAQTIARMRDSGLKMWICTGDKYETTLGIAKSCNLIKDYENVVPVISEKESVVVETLR